MRNLLYKQNGKRNFVVGGLMALVMAIGGTAACGSNHNTASVACADTAEMAFTLSSSGHHGSSSSGGSGTSGKSKSSGTSGTSGTTSSGSSGTAGRYGSNGGTNSGTTSGTGTTSGSSGTGSNNRYGSNGGTNSGTTSGTTSGTGSGTTFNKNAKTGLSGTVTMPKTIPAPPKGTTRVTVPGESAYTPPSNKVKQPKQDIQAAQASVQNRRFLMNSGSHYRSPVTKHVYYYHPRSYYTGSTYQDIYNPYDGRNYRSSGYGTFYGQWSPYWGLAFATMLVGSC